MLFDHDGGIDDLLSLLLLLRLPDIEVVGVSITPADCYAEEALLSTLKILALTNNTDIPVAVGKLAGPNPFPPDWRAQPKICNALPFMLRIPHSTEQVSTLPAHEWMANIINQSSQKLTVLMTGPATNLASVIRNETANLSTIDHIVWMGGAIDVQGNVAMHDHDQSAEWNAYWDPEATKTLINSKLNVCLVPLDATNALPVNRVFLEQLAKQNSPVSDLAGQLWAATVTAIPSYEFTYFLWDVLSTALLSLDEKYVEYETANLTVDTDVPSAGRIFRHESGTSTTWLKRVNDDYVRAFVVHYLSGSFNLLPKKDVNFDT